MRHKFTVATQVQNAKFDPVDWFLRSARPEVILSRVVAVPEEASVPASHPHPS